MSSKGGICPAKVQQGTTTSRSRILHRPADRIVAAAILCLGYLVVSERSPLFGATALSVWKASILPSRGVDDVAIDRAKFLSASSAAFGAGATLFVPKAYGSDVVIGNIDNKSSSSSNPRFIEENLSMTYGEDKNGNPRSRGILVRRRTGDSTPFRFPIQPYEFTKDWPEEWPFRETDFLRSDSNDDGWFYKVPRLVYHIDEPAVASLTQYYRKNIPSKSDILDICSSWVSHYPLEFPDTMRKICATGMSGLELQFNDQLTGGYETKDLNDDPKLPYPDNSFDAVTCVVSIDYLVQPVEVLREVHRVLRPGGKVIVSQSNRCFPSKAIAMVGLVCVGSFILSSIRLRTDGWFCVTPSIPFNLTPDICYGIHSLPAFALSIVRFTFLHWHRTPAVAGNDRPAAPGIDQW